MARPSAEGRGIPAIAPACVIVRGGTATGKTWLARGAQSDAAGSGLRVEYVGYGGARCVLGERRLLEADLLIVDDWLLGCALPDEEARLMEAIGRRCRAGSPTLVCTHRPPERWASLMGGGEEARRAVDDVLSRALVVELGVEAGRRARDGRP